MVTTCKDQNAKTRSGARGSSQLPRVRSDVLPGRTGTEMSPTPLRPCGSNDSKGSRRAVPVHRSSASAGTCMLFYKEPFRLQISTCTQRNTASTKQQRRSTCHQPQKRKSPTCTEQIPTEIDDQLNGQIGFVSICS